MGVIEMNDLIHRTIDTSKQTPIEIALQIDEEGKTTARKLYEYLELDKSNYSRWAKTNIENNQFAEENVDFWAFVINDEWGGQATKDYKLTATFAKKLAMTSHTERGEEARAYFIKVEDRLKEAVTQKQSDSKKIEIQKARAEAMLLNAKNRTFKTLMSVMKDKKLSPIAVEVFQLKGLESVFGIDVGNYLPETEKTYSATEVGNLVGCSANKIGKLANEYKLKTKQYGILVMNKSPYSTKEVSTFRYNDKAVEKIKEILESIKIINI